MPALGAFELLLRLIPRLPPTDGRPQRGLALKPGEKREILVVSLIAFSRWLARTVAVFRCCSFRNIQHKQMFAHTQLQSEMGLSDYMMNGLTV